MLKVLLFSVLTGLALSKIVDVFESTNGHEPRVAINCGKVPFYVDLETGAWVEDSEGEALCDEQSKEIVKKYCQKVYSKINVTNIVEANEPVLFNNWCAPGEDECGTAKQVTPYRCLVHEYEADALMVPNGCTFDHLHDESLCSSHDQWKHRAQQKCRETNMKLKDYGILLSCGTDVFTGVEFVCCPADKKSEKRPVKPVVVTETPNVIDVDAFSAAVKDFQKLMPLETQGCDRSQFVAKEAAMEDRHRTRIASVVEEWDEAEKRYNKLKQKDPVAAEEKMKRTLEVFRETLAALEQESKEEKNRLRVERATCINTDISKQKRDAMVAYVAAIEEKNPSAEKILEAVRIFIQVCEHDRVHSLRHFEHVRNRDAEKADAMRSELLQHLRQLNTIVNSSMALLNYLPEIAQQFGLTDSQFVLKPKVVQPEYLPEPDHDHKEIPDELKVKEPKEMELKEEHANTFRPTEDSPSYKTIGEDQLTPVFNEGNLSEDDAVDKYDDTHEKQERRHHKQRHHKHHDGADKEHSADRDERRSKKPAGFAAVIGLSCGGLVIMLGVLIALVARRKRMTHAHVIIPTDENEDQEHLVAMQKKGFENPTYKFYYY